MKKIVLAFALIFGGLNVSAQFDFNPKDLLKILGGGMESDRPGQALNAKTCGILTAQIQTGGSYFSWNLGLDTPGKNFSTPTQIRLGLSPNFELNTSFSFVHNSVMGFWGPSKTNGFPSPHLGARYSFLKGDRWKPFMALQANMSFPSSRGTYQQPKMGSSFYLITSNRFDILSINTNVGAFFGGSGIGADQVSIPYVLNLGFSLSKKWSAFGEVYGELRSQSWALDGGVGFLVLPTLQLDLLGGWNASFFTNNNLFVELGVTWKYSFLQMIAKKKIDQMLGGMKG
jgi:hypothetical protein